MKKPKTETTSTKIDRWCFKLNALVRDFKLSVGDLCEDHYGRTFKCKKVTKSRVYTDKGYPSFVSAEKCAKVGTREIHAAYTKFCGGYNALSSIDYLESQGWDFEEYSKFNYDTRFFLKMDSLIGYLLRKESEPEQPKQAKSIMVLPLKEAVPHLESLIRASRNLVTLEYVRDVDSFNGLKRRMASSMDHYLLVKQNASAEEH